MKTRFYKTLRLCSTLCVAAMFLCSASCTNANDSVMKTKPAPHSRTFDGKEYKLTFHDEFDGNELDMTKWEHRIKGQDHKRSTVFTPEASWLDGKGKLVISSYTKPRSALTAEKDKLFKPTNWIPHTSMLRTKKEFTFGYHEVRLKMPIVKGVGMSVWMQSRGQTRKPASPDPKVGAEIDLIEQTFFNRAGEPNDYKHSTIHWGGYGKTHQWVSITVEPKSMKQTHDENQDEELNLKNKKNSKNGLIQDKIAYYSDNLSFRDEKFHTVGLLWTPEYYKFYYDGELIGTIKKGVSHAPGYMILWPRLFNFHKLVGNTENGLGDKENTKAKFIIDYYRVYTAK